MKRLNFTMSADGDRAMNRTFILTSILAGVAACATAPEVLPFDVQAVPSAVETEPMAGVGDRADDPAIWVSDTDDQPSLILGTNKDEGLHVYDLSGKELQFLNVGAINNVDVRGRYAVASNDEVGALTWFVAKNFLYKPAHITLLNIAADDTEIVPEFLQKDLRPETVAAEARRILEDLALRQAQIDAQNKALSRMGERDEAASEIAAQAILSATSVR